MLSNVLSGVDFLSMSAWLSVLGLLTNSFWLIDLLAASSWSELIACGFFSLSIFSVSSTDACIDSLLFLLFGASCTFLKVTPRKTKIKGHCTNNCEKHFHFSI